MKNADLGFSCAFFFFSSLFHLSEGGGGGDKWEKRCLVVLAGDAQLTATTRSTGLKILTERSQSVTAMQNITVTKTTALNLAALQPSNQAHYSFN